MERRRVLAGAMLLAGVAFGVRASAMEASTQELPLFDRLGFRATRYRAVIDRAPTPAISMPLDRALRLHPGKDALFLDVLPAEGGHLDRTSGRWMLAESHDTIPGSLWFPETGRGVVDPLLWSALTARVEAVRHDHPDWPIVVFCRADCWMSWNASRRLARAGVANVFWFAEGIDGWHDAGRALVQVVPETVSVAQVRNAS
ncbi:rhodanese-like domain-containing protein [Novosphingobium nitrogenifigens]|nr:rhodanese-like domain-containing protein [Novosphingobium nitrogenifigens]